MMQGGFPLIPHYYTACHTACNKTLDLIQVPVLHNNVKDPTITKKTKKVCGILLMIQLSQSHRGSTHTHTTLQVRVIVVYVNATDHGEIISHSPVPLFVPPLPLYPFWFSAHDLSQPVGPPLPSVFSAWLPPQIVYHIQ